MAEAHAPIEQPPAAEEEPIVLRRPMRETAEMDITPMIDITFLLLIFFLVSSQADKFETELPRARYGTAVSAQASVVVTIADEGNDKVRVFLGEGKRGEPLPVGTAGENDAIRAVLQKGAPRMRPDDHEAQEELIRKAVQMGRKLDKQTVLIMAERGVRAGEVRRVMAAAGEEVEDAIHIGVLESD